jgi:tRNA(fMet)-specific endonuclease VapC
MIMLDSNTCVFLIRQKSKVIEQFSKNKSEVIGISSIVFYELEYGVRLKNIAPSRQKDTRSFLRSVQVYDFTHHEATIAAEIESGRKKAGKSIGVEDAFIAAHAIALNALLVTSNTKHFEGTPGLQLADWSK